MKEGNAKRQSAVWVFVSGGVLIAAAIIALYTPWFQICDVREVIVSGNQHASASELVALAQLHRNQTIFSVPANLVRSRIEAHPWIKQASVRRVFPHTISLVVEERRVLAWSQHPSENITVAVAEGGIIVGPGYVDSASLELVGATTSGWDSGDRLVHSQVADLIASLQGGVCQLAVLSVDVTDLRSIELFLENDLQVRLGEIDRAQERLRAVRALCQEIEIDGYELIDVRFGGEATLVPRKAVRR
ncbi:MAG: FtsQ-type POTRA domain-containing protein [Candidatus Atribacteria bacterium]|nr:MAG: FtsQ-type POTRA domain-containing protein [Candidatus Atribacteria bacterium]